MVDADRNFEALIVFHKAIAVAILALDEWTPEQCTSGNFLNALDEFLSDIPKAPYIPNFPDMDGSEMFKRVRVFRSNLDVALDQARRAKSRYEDLGD